MRQAFVSSIALSTVILIGCPKKEEAPAEPAEHMEHMEHAAEAGEAADAGEPAEGVPTAAECKLEALGDSGVSGMVTFTAVDGGVEVKAHVEGLEPNSKHGFHIHEKGDCSAPDGTSAGGHFNPMSVDHAGPDMPSHVGDLGNLEADDTGMAMLTVVKKGATMGSGETDIIGKGMIVHAKPDDLKSQPTGAAGPRIACGVIAAQ